MEEQQQALQREELNHQRLLQERQQEEEHEHQECLAVQQVQQLSQALLSQALAEYNEGSGEHYEQD